MMKFKGDTVECDVCDIEFNADDDQRHPDSDDPLCPVCASKNYNGFLKTSCAICGKPMSDERDDAYQDMNGEVAHKSCVEKLSDEEVEKREWYNEF